MKNFVPSFQDFILFGISRGNRNGFLYIKLSTLWSWPALLSQLGHSRLDWFIGKLVNIGVLVSKMSSGQRLSKTAEMWPIGIAKIRVQSAITFTNYDHFICIVSCIFRVYGSMHVPVDCTPKCVCKLYSKRKIALVSFLGVGI